MLLFTANNNNNNKSLIQLNAVGHRITLLNQKPDYEGVTIYSKESKL